MQVLGALRPPGTLGTERLVDGDGIQNGFGDVQLRQAIGLHFEERLFAEGLVAS